MSTPASQIPDFDSFVHQRGAGSPLPPPDHAARRAPAREHLPPVDPRLDSFVQNVMADASARSGYTYRLGEGSRTPEQQAGKVAAGYSRTYHSKHLTGHGRDVLAFDPSGNYVTDGASAAYKALGDVYREKAAAAGLPIRWGGDFHDFPDPGHFEIENDGAAAPAASSSVEPPDFDSFVASRNVPDFEDWKARRASGDDDVVTVNARNAVTPAPPPTSALPARASYDLQTMEGRARRDSRAALERTPGAYLEVSVPVSDVAHADGSQLVHDAYRSAVEARGVPGEFFDEWAKVNAPTGYHIRNGRGEELTAADAYDEGSKAARLRLDANHVSQIVDAYKRSRGTFGRLKDWAASDEESSGEKVLDAAGAVAAPVARAGGYVARPLQAASAAVFSAARGNNPLPVAYKTLTTGETPAEGTNPVGNYLRDSAVLKRINPRLGRVLGSGADILLDPANLIGFGLLGKGAEAVAGAGRIGRAAEEVNALGRSLGVLERGLVEARPLGLAAAGAGEGGDVAALEDRLSRVVEVTRKLKAGEALTPEETALHAEVRAAAEAAPSPAVRGEQLRYARERSSHYANVADTAKSAGARRAARELADDYAQEVARLEGGAERAPAAESYDLNAPRDAAPPSSAPPRSLVDRALDVLGIPKAVMASGDLSAPGRQGIIFLLTKPFRSAQATGDMLRAITAAGHENVLRGMAEHPKFGLAQDSGLYLANFGAGEEVFGGTVARHIPGVKVSDRTFETFLDSQRLRVFNDFADELIADGITPATHPEEFQSLASWVNKATGRGDLGRFDKLSRVGNALMFSPKLAVSRYQILSPTTYLKMTPAARKIAMRKMLQFTGTLGGLLGAAHFAGADITLDPRSSDFGKIVVGKTHVDLSGGNAYMVRFLTRFAQATYRAATGAQMKTNETPAALAAQFLRSKLSPAASLAVDAATGKTMEGEPFTWKGAAFERFVPLFAQDLTDAMEQEGWMGAIHAAPSGLGFGVNTYDAPRRGGRHAGRRGAQEGAASPEPQSNHMQLEGEPVSRNVEDRRGSGPRADSSRWTDEDSAALSEEVGRSGSSPVSDEEGVRVGRLLDSLDDKRFAGFARNLDEHYNSGVLRPLESAATKAVEYGAEGLARLSPSKAGEYHNLAEVARTLRALAEERAARPVQFMRDALSGKYGEKMRSEVEEGISYPQNHFPTPATSPPTHEEIRKAVDGASPDAEPTFRAFPEGMGESSVPRASMPQVKSAHRGAMVQFLKARGISHTQEEVPAGSLRPSQAEWSPEKVKRALSYEGPERSILVSSDGYVADGHHQWLAAVHKSPNRRIRVIRLDAPIQQLLVEMARFPSSGVDDASA
ncbi:MAG: M15 family metallopeptidase [Pyrinomonadaceae bacterium]